MCPPKEVTPEPKPRYLMERLRDAAKSIESIAAEGTNAHFKYKFVEEAEVVAAVRKVLFENDILFMADMQEVTQTRYATERSEKTVTLVKLKLSYVCMHTKQSIDSTWFGEAHDTGDKGISKALVSAIKYFFLKTLLIPKAGDDTEADASTDRPAMQAKVAASRPQAAPAAPRPAAPRPAAPRQAMPQDEMTPGGAPKQLGNEPPERTAAREAFYKAMRECEQSTGIENIKKMAVEAMNLSEPPRSLYHIDAAGFGYMTQWVYDNYSPGIPTFPPADDKDIPF